MRIGTRGIASVLAAAALALAAVAVEAADMTQAEVNKKAVMEFYDKALNEKDFAAASAYLGSRYVQHNPNAAGGPAGLKAFL